ncbi:hypothetical protein B9D02_05260 [Pantoea vagans]|nr:hypothetical protein [Pantoea vagans]AWP32019.1 hypothetical protein B9D02_05260 [Pantoea vagans]
MQNQQLSDVKGRELVAAGRAFAKAIGMDTPLIEIAKMMAELATRLDCALVRGDELQAQRDALAAENAALKDGAEYFMYGPDCGFERYDSQDEAVKAANEMIDSYREDAGDGWCDEVEQVCFGIVISYSRQHDVQQPSEDNGLLGSVDYMMSAPKTPATDAYLNSVRAEGIEQWVSSREPKWNGTTEDAKRFAAQLRAGKDGE